MTPEQSRKYDVKFHRAYNSLGQTASTIAFLRYEYVRKLNPQQFAELHERNVRGEGRFDDLVDNLIAEEK